MSPAQSCLNWADQQAAVAPLLEVEEEGQVIADEEAQRSQFKCRPTLAAPAAHRFPWQERCAMKPFRIALCYVVVNSIVGEISAPG
jgi:hypothetical protein